MDHRERTIQGQSHMKGGGESREWGVVELRQAGFGAEGGQGIIRLQRREEERKGREGKREQRARDGAVPECVHRLESRGGQVDKPSIIIIITRSQSVSVGVENYSTAPTSYKQRIDSTEV